MRQVVVSAPAESKTQGNVAKELNTNMAEALDKSVANAEKEDWGSGKAASSSSSGGGSGVGGGSSGDAAKAVADAVKSDSNNFSEGDFVEADLYDNGNYWPVKKQHQTIRERGRRSMHV